jgi:hypothetical protein
MEDQVMMDQEQLGRLIALANRAWRDMTPEQKQEMLRTQAEGWARSEAQWAKDYAEGKCERD